MNQHFVPRVYLRQWLNGDGFFIRYRRMGPPNSIRLLSERKTPDGVYWARDLYSLPEKTMANGLTGDGVEHLLSANVEQRIASIVSELGGCSGRLEPGLSEQVRWLIQTFVARDPRTIAAIEARVASFVKENEAEVLRLHARAQTSTMRSEIGQYLDPRMPAVQARAMIAGIAASQLVPRSGWLDGVVRVMHSSKIARELGVLGLDGFPTFERPVVEWGDNDVGLVATFSIAPEILAFVVQGEGECGWEMALRHVAGALRHRRSAICRQKAADDLWLSEAQHLIPWAQGE
ncbi:DUF4238 domain-containing protein [Corallococcus sp. bb12-1]|uniref:DUF4238 domain-containing protein n=1 Tax=Corallococcus sp. bb12-1 TaxID=2996784 RepID=UPI00226FA1D6|nr:DUF4238 domain-containing protein [Corallococcus sp. bb12-1]MCY1045596.1 DUF4238 domain-containing protein [Corallococcus sp. bb12-1]